jgi:hypothetical protein
MKSLKILLFLFSISFLWSCSWVQYFMVINESNQPFEVSYRLTAPEKTFAIFENKPTAYELKKPGQINWDKKLELTDLDTSFETVKLQLPANTALIFGYLHNDKYTSTNQYFINGRSFNLVEMTISTSTKSTSVTPENFDAHFKKQNGSIVWVES